MAIAAACNAAALEQLVPPLQARLKAAVEAEQQYEEALIKSLYAKNNIRRLQKDGLVLLGLQVCIYAQLLPGQDSICCSSIQCMCESAYLWNVVYCSMVFGSTG